MYKITLLIVSCVSVALALPNPQGAYKVPNRRPQQGQSYDQQPQPSHKSQPIDNYVEEPRPYAFDYGVKDQYSGANFGHSESSDGNAVTGSYTVALPDGRIQRVTYTADEYSGFKAEVTYEGEAQYPEYIPNESKQYQQPQPAPLHRSSPSQPQQVYRARRL